MPQYLILLIDHPLWLVKFSTLSPVLPNHKRRGDVPMGEGGLQGLEPTPIGYGHTLHKTDFEAQLKIMEGRM